MEGIKLLSADEAAKYIESVERLGKARELPNLSSSRNTAERMMNWSVT